VNPLALFVSDDFHHGFNSSLMLQRRAIYYSFGVGTEEEHRSSGSIAAAGKHRRA
jgi:hypothetical protein